RTRVINVIEINLMVVLQNSVMQIVNSMAISGKRPATITRSVPACRGSPDSRSPDSQPFFCQSVCSLIGWNALSFSHIKNLEQGIVNGIELLEHARHIPAKHFNAGAGNNSTSI